MHVIDYLPVWGVFIFTAAVVALGFECGFRWGKSPKGAGRENPQSAANVNVVLSMLAFMLAFVFGLAADRYNGRRVLVMQEANAIGTTYLRADLLPDDATKAVQSLLRQYVSLRLQLMRDLQTRNTEATIFETVTKGDAIRAQLWDKGLILKQRHLETPVTSLFIQSLNEMFDIESQRIFASLYGRLPDVTWAVLYTLTIIGVGGLGYECGCAGKRNVTTAAIVVFSFGLVMMMIADLERPYDGFVRTGQEPIIDLAKKIGAD